MRNLNIEETKTLLEQHSGHPLVIAEEALLAAIENPAEESSIAIKVLSVFGGLLASLAFCGFLFLAGVFSSNWSMLIFGIISIGVGLLIPKFDKKIVWDTSSAAFYGVGLICVGIAMESLRFGFNNFLLLGIAIALLTIYLNNSYILTFLATLQIIGFKVSWIIMNDIPQLLQVYIAVLAIFLCYLFLNEGRLLLWKFVGWQRYYPIRTAALIGALAMLLSGDTYYYVDSAYTNSSWLSSIVVILLVAYLLFRVSAILGLTSLMQRWAIAAAAIILLAPTLLYVPISYSILLLLLSFYTRYKTGFIISIVAFLYFISKFYYDLYYTLLHKSILLFSTGVLFLICYLLIYKKLETDEKI